MKKRAGQPKMLQMIDHLIRENRGDPGIVHALNQVRDRIKLPMSHILAKVPGVSISDRAAKIGISRQAYYQWLNGYSRPNPEQAERLAKLTGFSVKAIRGTTRLAPPTVTTATAPAT
jgi:transcriptional regulator with XRE-family HTH domain